MLQDWQTRVVCEKDVLESKIVKLQDFINSGKTDDIPLEDGTLLREQLTYMQKYLYVLNARIARFPKG